jgi:DNA-nicking Smr family endonuclease
MNDADKALFLTAMQGVTPLQTLETHPDLQTQRPSQRRAHPRRASEWKQQAGYSDVGVAYVLGPESTIEIRQSGLRDQDFLQLKRGLLSVQAHLDLHGLRVEQARQHTFEFIHRAHQQELRVLRIVHGKGQSSKDLFPVLKNHVAHWLGQEPLVLAACSAPAQQGGKGAVCLLLRRAQGTHPESGR